MLNRFWADLICAAIAIVFLNGAITGRFYTHGRGGRHKQIASVKSFQARIAFLLIAIGTAIWLIKDLRNKLQP
jgi:hypothetical protein